MVYYMLGIVEKKYFYYQVLGMGSAALGDIGVDLGAMCECTLKEGSKYHKTLPVLIFIMP